MNSGLPEVGFPGNSVKEANRRTKKAILGREVGGLFAG